nr:rhomboid family intramembrane serine protease [uncultured Flavobacterium sp.]
MMRITDTVKHLIIINVLFFVASLVIKNGVLHEYLDLHFILNPAYKPWQFITYMFMHANVGHIFSNMLGLFVFGPMLEMAWGQKRFLFFYFSCGIGAALLHFGIEYYEYHRVMSVLNEHGYSASHVLSTLADGKALVAWQELVMNDDLISMYSAYMGTLLGASGALYGLMAAYAFMFPEQEMIMLFFPIPIKVKYFVPFIILGDLVMGVRGAAIFGATDGIAHFAHIGGAAVGVLMVYIWRNNKFNHKRWN